MTEAAFVSVVMPVRDEAGHVGDALDAILANDYPRDRMEVLVLDGGSTDGTRAAVSERAGRDARVRLLDNPGGTAPSGLNAGVAAAGGEIIVRVDARTLPEADYVRTLVELLAETGAWNVGGPQRAVGAGIVGRAAAIATTSPFGVGDARFRTSDRAEWVDSVYLGAWRRETLERLGGFDERAVVNQDYELNYRLRLAGGRILLSPRVRCAYRVRDTFGGLARQYYRYGRGKLGTLRLHPESLRWRQLAAPALVAGLAASAAAAPFLPVAGLALPAVYAAGALGASLVGAARGGWGAFPALPGVFATMHLSWGVGFWSGLARQGPPRPFLRPLLGSLRTPRNAQGLPNEYTLPMLGSRSEGTTSTDAESPR